MIIRRLSVDYLVPGMVTAGDIYGHGELLIENNHALTESMIKNIAAKGIRFVPIREDVIKVAKDKPRISDEERLNPNNLSVIKASKGFNEFSYKFNEAAQELKECFNNISSGTKAYNADELLSIVDKLEQIPNSVEKLMDMLRCQRDYDEQIFVHSINVSLISGVCASWLKLNDEVVRDIKLAGLLHDIGKMKLPMSIVQKPDKLTEEEYNTIMQHPLLGYQILKDCDISEDIRLAALEHHEKCDGTGYPEKLSNNNISMYAKIVAIADVYDAMTAARCYRAPLCHFDVINTIFNDTYTKFDYAYTSVFLKNIAMAYRNRTVKLSDGSCGEIMFIGDSNPARPIIMTDNGLLDLSSKPEIDIVQVL